MSNAASGVARAVESLTPAGDAAAVVVAIDGRSAAGKSTLVRDLAARLGAAVVHMDDFYRDEAEAARRAHDARGGVQHYFDCERMVREALLHLRAGRSAQFRPFNWELMAVLSDPVTVEPASVLIVEGVYSARPEHRPYLDLRVLVEAPDPVRLQRRRERHELWDWEALWDAAEGLYFQEIARRETFDLVVSGLGPVPTW